MASAYPSEATVLFSDYQQLTSIDLNDAATTTQASLDNVVAAFLAAGQGYTGLSVSANSDAFGVTVNPGLLYNIGGGYPLRSAEPIDLTPQINLIPDSVSSQIVLIVANSGATLTSEKRTLEDASRKPSNPADLWPTVQTAVTTRNVRAATPSIVPGVVAASNVQAPAYNPLLCLLATVTLNKTGVISVVQNTAAQITRLDQLAPLVLAQGNLLAGNQTLIAGLLSSVSSLASQLKALQQSDAAQFAALQAALTALENRQVVATTPGVTLNVTDTYTDATGLTVQPNNPGYAVGTGLGFPLAVANPTTFAPIAQYGQNVEMIGGRYLTLPFTSTKKGDANDGGNHKTFTQNQYQLAPGSIATWNTALQIKGFGVARTRYGAAYAASPAAQLLATGSPSQLFSLGASLAYDPTWADWRSTNPEMNHLNGYWHDLTGRGYWTPRLADGATGAVMAASQIFQTAYDDMIADFSVVVTAGVNTSFRLMVCEDFSGTPDPTTVRMDVTAKAQSNGNQFVDFTFPYPLLRKAGVKYHFVVMSGDNVYFYAQVTPTADQSMKSLIYKTSTGWAVDQNGGGLQCRYGLCTFTPGAPIEMNLLYLGGGIDAVDILTPALVPAGCDILYGTIPSGSATYQRFGTIDPTNAASNLLAGRPSQVRLFLELTSAGSTAPIIDTQASISGSAGAASARQSGTLTAQSPVRTPSGPVTKITRQVTLSGFIPGTHTYTELLDTGSGYATKTPPSTTSTPVVQADGTTLIIFSWTLGAPVTSFMLDYNGTTSDTTKQFTIPKAITTAAT